MIKKMKKTSTATRLREIMNDRNLRQVDILNLAKPYCEQYGVKLNKSDLSQYCSGKVEPNQDKLFILSTALKVNVSWLMGYEVDEKPEKYAVAKRGYGIFKSITTGFNSFGWDVDIEQIDDDTIEYVLSNESCSITVDEKYFDGIEKRLKKFLMAELSSIFEKERKSLFGASHNLAAAHERTDIEVTDEMRKHDDDIMNDDSEWE